MLYNLSLFVFGFIIGLFIMRVKTYYFHTGKIISGNLFRAHNTDAGQDVFSDDCVFIPPRSSAIISTGLKIEIPNGYMGLLWSRSGLSVKHKIEVGAGCIDSGYRGEVKVHLYNHSDVEYLVEKGDKIAQLLTVKVNLNNYVPIKKSSKSSRGETGFGNSGK